MEGAVYGFGRFRLFVRERVLLKDDVTMSLGSRAFDVLVALVERDGQTVNRQELFELVWPDVVVAKVNLRVHIAGLRKVLGDGQDGNRFIVSVAGRGYRFVAPVRRLQSAVPAAGRGLGRVCFVDFAGVDDPAGVAMAVASALECEGEAPQPLSCVLDYLRDKQMLLVFDNCAHVFTGVAQLTELLITETPLIHVIVSSREALRLAPLTRSPQHSNPS